MEIFVNDQAYQPAGAVGTIHEVTQGLCQGSSGQQFVVSLRCDGCDVAPEQLETVLQRSICEFEKIELQTQSGAALICQTLSGTLQLFSGIQELCGRCADLLAAGQQVPAMQSLQQFFDVWRQVQEAVLVCAQALDVRLDDLQVAGQTVADIANSVRAQFSELKSAMEVGDFVLVGDILRYELTEPLESWRQLLETLARQAEAQQG